jgi:hypothetical protein
LLTINSVVTIAIPFGFRTRPISYTDSNAPECFRPPKCSMEEKEKTTSKRLESRLSFLPPRFRTLIFDDYILVLNIFEDS